MPIAHSNENPQIFKPLSLSNSIITPFLFISPNLLRPLFSSFSHLFIKSLFQTHDHSNKFLKWRRKQRWPRFSEGWGVIAMRCCVWECFFWRWPSFTTSATENRPILGSGASAGFEPCRARPFVAEMAADCRMRWWIQAPKGRARAESDAIANFLTFL